MKAHPQLEARIRIGARLREIRLSKQWTQQQVADAIGMAMPTISKIEAGKWNFGIDTIEAYARLFGKRVEIK